VTETWQPDAVGAPLDPPADILDLLEPHLTGHPDRLAITDETGQFTYGELDALSRAVAGQLPAEGTVIVHARLSRWAVAGMIGALRAGVGYVPIDADFPVDRQRQMASASRATVSLTQPGGPALPGIERVIDLTTPLESPHPLSLPVDAVRPAYTCFTSGSTGAPQPVVISTAELAYSTAARIAYYPTQPERYLLCSSISFDSSVAGIYWTLACGGRLVIGGDRPGDPMAITRAMRAHRPTHLLTIPSLYLLLLTAARRSAAGWDALTTAVVAGETCQPDLVRLHHETLPNTVLYNEYGPTECTVWSTVHRCTAADGDAAAVPIGRPIPGTTAFVRGQAGEELPRGERGVLWIAGPGVARSLAGNWPCHRTGDVVTLDDDGLLRFHGRADDQLKLGGHRIERGEIEAAIRSNTAVLDVAVGIRHRLGEPELVAFIVPTQAGATTDPRRLREYLLTRLPAAALPARIRLLDALPLTPTGKVDRRALDEAAEHDG
jgi:D-alanine--poly(phosphoribitol) ligase subunit 1